MIKGNFSSLFKVNFSSRKERQGSWQSKLLWDAGLDISRRVDSSILQKVTSSQIDRLMHFCALLLGSNLNARLHTQAFADALQDSADKESFASCETLLNLLAESAEAEPSQ